MVAEHWSGIVKYSEDEKHVDRKPFKGPGERLLRDLKKKKSFPPPFNKYFQTVLWNLDSWLWAAPCVPDDL